MKNTKVQKMIAVAMFAAMAVVLQYVAFPVIPAFSFMKVDFSDIPVMLSMFLFGPGAGILTAFLRSALHLLTTGLEPTNMVGDVASFLATSLFTLPMFYFFNKGTSSRKNKILGVVTGIFALTVFMSLANYFVITPLYLSFYGVTATQFLGTSLGQYVAIGVIPFNLVKGIIVSGVFLAIYLKLYPWLTKKQREKGRVQGM
ncbi:ECF transporter S component [Enterococcus asini]|uniref:ECF transporter S component n=1 Tax=Enterococcus asini TaxID=57732 RepID=UPI001386DCE0|nr:ECF transporter S component [Enterococcus asini]MCD5028971.1 ECF transporter S component [Enterococcus asini]MDT2744354.1 ECF transporter S component [Enterococcus asini]MDT2764790.1 ECF transporter S component [Enterococcus asini]MDT2783999.1 ECF transporter S component [Enterococcus asini]